MTTPGKTEVSRYKTISEKNPDSPYLMLPDVDGYGYLLTDLEELGYCSNAGFGPAVLSYSEIEAWAHLTRTTLTPFEAKAIRQLSASFCAERRNAEDEKAPVPYLAEVEPTPEVRKKVDGLFRGLLQRQKDRSSGMK